MENRAYAFAAGLFTLFLGAAVVGVALWFSGETYEKVYYVLESKSPVTGLFEQAGVRFRGVDVGKVSNIRFDPKDKRLILIEVGIEAGTPVTRGTYAEIRPQGVTGLSYIMLDDTGANPEPLPPAGARGSTRIVVKPTLLENLFAASQDVLADVRQVAQRVSAVLSDDNRQRLTTTLVSLQKASERIAAVAESAQPALQSVAPLAEDARKTLKHVDTVLTDISGATRELSARMQALERVAGGAEKTSASLGTLADRVTNESLPRINLLVEELTRTSRGLDRFLAEVKDQPQSIVFGRKAGPPGPGEQGFEARARGGR
jgi:phospholipid/cholesterol/gamma-HCH transport system substrate-binding protein